MPRKLSTLALLLAAPGLFLAAQAPQAPQAPPADEASELMALLNTPIESASKRVQKAIESPQAVEVITAEQIKASGVFRFIDVLRLATSVQVWDEAPDRANVTIRGVNPSGNPRTIQLLVDGVPLFNLVASPIDFNGIPVPLDAIERVEIVRGPSSSLYGANAQMGVIAITTKRAKEGFSGSVRAAGTNNSGTRSDAFLAMGTGPFSLTASVAGSSDSNLDKNMKVLGFPDQSVPQDSARKELQAFVRPEFDLGEAGRIWAAIGYGDTGHEDQVSRSAWNPASPATSLKALAIFPDQEVSRQIFQLGWSKAITPTLRAEVKYNQKVLRLDMDPLRVDPSNQAQSTAIVHLLETIDPALATPHSFYYDRIREGSVQVNWDIASNLHVVAGGDTKGIFTGANKTIGLAEDMSFTASGGFVSVDWTLDALTLSGGARMANETLGGSSTSPRFSAVYDLGASGVLRAGYFTSTRSPMVQEKLASIPNIPVLAYLQNPNPGIKPEKVDDLEFGYRKNWERLSVDFTYYHNTLKGLIASVDTGLPKVGGKPVDWFANNPNDFVNSGVELSVTGEPVPGWLVGFNLATASFKDPIYGLDQQADFSPKGTGNLWVRTHKGMFFAYAAAQYVAAYTVAFNGVRSDVAAHTQIHFNVGVEPWKWLSVSAYGVNATSDTSDASNYGLVNQFALRYTRREVGLQAAVRF